VLFMSTAEDPANPIGELVSTEPNYQGSGIGTDLTEVALDRLKDAGMKVAMVATGGDPGHAAARRTCENAGCILLPTARYVKNLQPRGAVLPPANRPLRFALRAGRRRGLLPFTTSPRTKPGIMRPRDTPYGGCAFASMPRYL
jgi:hypothetical protein